MKYYSEEYVIGGSDQVGVTFDAVTFSKVSKAVDRIQQMSNEMDFIAVLEYNLQDFFCSTKIAGSDGRRNFTKLNCCFSNFLNSFYTWKWYHDCIWRDIFLGLLEQYRKKHIIYRLGERLRNYTTHKAFAITGYRYDVINEIPYFIIDPNQLLKWEDPKHKLNATLKNWLKEQVENETPIEAYTFATEFYQLCREIQNELWTEQVQLIHDDLSAIFTILPSGFSNVYNVSILSEDHTVHMGIGQIVAQFLKKAAYQYSKFIPDGYMGRF